VTTNLGQERFVLVPTGTATVDPTFLAVDVASCRVCRPFVGMFVRRIQRRGGHVEVLVGVTRNLAHEHKAPNLIGCINPSCGRSFVLVPASQ